ncbi:ABC transporter ATP-binding protein [uncultured Friedmanniella sp.]|uniref:ABC transporter ATP-binding protein n=1 Tax=uncultured Friedmanniella sp. TaxID=335381 RepID=UPI0035CC54F9
MGTLLEVESLVQHFNVPGRRGTVVHAVDDVSFDVREGETLGLVGESGCGKSTLGRTLIRLNTPTAGRLRFAGTDISQLSERQLRPYRRDLQMVFQDPFASLNPRRRISDIIGDPLLVHGERDPAARHRKVTEMLDRVGLPSSLAGRYPRGLSGGQRQRVGIARALVMQPRLVVADEPVSGLDVSVQAQVVNLLEDVQEELGLTYLFISHDLAVVRQIADRIGVMYLGRLVELCDSASLYTAPMHPYTEALLSAVPIPDPRLSAAREQIVLQGDVPSPINPPSGCRFRTRCHHATDLCVEVDPPLAEAAPGRLVACHYPRSVNLELLAGRPAGV